MNIVLYFKSAVNSKYEWPFEIFFNPSTGTRLSFNISIKWLVVNYSFLIFFWTNSKKKNFYIKIIGKNIIFQRTKWNVVDAV